jgi:hypothetical protein
MPGITDIYVSFNTNTSSMYEQPIAIQKPWTVSIWPSVQKFFHWSLTAYFGYS